MFDLTAVELTRVASRYPVLVSPFLRQRIERGDYSEAALKQFAPEIAELAPHARFTADPTGEAQLQDVPGLVRAYGNRCALLVTTRCLVYCRFCFRKAIVGHDQQDLADEHIEAALSTIRSSPSVRDVLLTGGDPAAANEKTLRRVITELDQIAHVKAIRFHTRALTAAPSAFATRLTRILSSSKKIWLFAHVNHADDIDCSESRAAIDNLRQQGIPILTQTVLLRGVNDSPATLRSLYLACNDLRMVAYHLYLLDRVEGAAHFDISDQEVKRLYSSLQDLPGPAIPTLVFVDKESIKRRTVASTDAELQSFLDQRGLTT